MYISGYAGKSRSGFFQMEPVYYVIAILGCADGSAQCTPVATMPTQYASQSACSAKTEQALIANTDFDFPTIVAECRAARPRARAEQDGPDKVATLALRG